MRKAFTLIEFIFVIAVLGILSIGGTSMFMQIYDTYFESRTYNDMQIKAQLAIDQISNRLSARIKNSVVQSVNTTSVSLESAGPIAAGTNYRLEWIASSDEALRGIATAATYTEPGWSGFIDLDNSSGSLLNTPGSTLLTGAAPILASLSDGDVNLTTNVVSGSNAAIIFPDAAGSATQYGWNDSIDISLTHRVSASAEAQFIPIAGTNFSGVANEVYEQYQLVYTAYALEYNITSRDLTLFYNYQPWNGEIYTQGDSTLFVSNVSNFVFKSIGSILKIQICINRADDDIVATGEKYSICKERAIF